MYIKQHKNATATPIIRSLIQGSTEPINVLARKLGLSWRTVRKWKNRDNSNDVSSRPHKTRTTLTPYQEDLIVFERTKFKKTVDEIFFSLESEIKGVYPMKIYRCLVRHGLSVLPKELIDAERKIRRFRRYTIGYLHIDALYTPRINRTRWYVFTCIDRVSKVAYVWLTDHKTMKNGTIFLKKVLLWYPYPIHYVLTDNGFEFTYKSLVKSLRTKKIHSFDQVCKENNIEHRTIKFNHPWTNGMVERFNGKIKTKVFKKYLFPHVEDLNLKLREYINHYNFVVRLKQLGYQTPTDYLKTKFTYLVQPIVI